MTITFAQVLEDALRSCDPEPYDGEHESLYYRSFAETLDAHLRSRGLSTSMDSGRES